MIPNLIEDFKEYQTYEVLNPFITEDGQGGQMTVYVPGLRFKATVTQDDSPEVEIAHAQGVRGNYNVTTRKEIQLPHNTIFRRISDGKTYRITAESEFTPPASSGIDMRASLAEEFKLPYE